MAAVMQSKLTWREIKRIVAAKLLAWAEFRRRPEYPTAGVSSWYKRVSRVKATSEEATVLPAAPSANATSPQEQWAIRHQVQLAEAAAIEHTLSRMSEEQRKLVFARFIEGRDWSDVATELHVSEAEVYRMWDRVAAVMAHALGVESCR